MFPGNAYVHPGIVHARNRRRQPMRHKRAFHSNHHVNRRIQGPRHFRPGQEALLNNASPYLRIAHNRKPPWLLIARRRCQPRSFENLKNVRLWNRVRLVGSTAHASGNQVNQTPSPIGRCPAAGVPVIRIAILLKLRCHRRFSFLQCPRLRDSDCQCRVLDRRCSCFQKPDSDTGKTACQVQRQNNRLHRRCHSQPGNLTG